MPCFYMNAKYADMFTTAAKVMRVPVQKRILTSRISIFFGNVQSALQRKIVL